MSRILDLVLAGTPPQFDNDDSLATSEHVQRALGNSRGFLGVTANTTLTAAHCGRDIYASTTTGTITLTLPGASTLPAGSKFKILNTGVNDVIVTRVGPDTIVLGTTTNTVTAVTLRAGDWIELTSLGSGTLWYHSGGTSQLGYSGAFGSLLAINGWQRLPSGLIMQWGKVNAVPSGSGVAVTFPIAFPTACLNNSATINNTGGNGTALSAGVGTPSTTGMTVFHNGTNTATAITWFAIGH